MWMGADLLAARAGDGSTSEGAVMPKAAGPARSDGEHCKRRLPRVATCMDGTVGGAGAGGGGCGGFGAVCCGIKVGAGRASPWLGGGLSCISPTRPKRDFETTGVPGRGSDFITLLRRLHANAPVKKALWAAGWLLVVGGLLQGVSELVSAHPFLVLVNAGAFCLAASAAWYQDGFVARMSLGGQAFLVKATMFDVFHDDASFSNFGKHWRRFCSLCSSPSEQRIDHLLQGLDVEWVHTLLSRPLLGYLPGVAQRVLLPEERLMPAHNAAAGGFSTSPAAEAWRLPTLPGAAAQSAPVRGTLDVLQQASESGTLGVDQEAAVNQRPAAPEPVAITKRVALRAEAIKLMSRQMEMARNRCLTEPVLMPVILRSLAFRLVGDEWRRVRSMLAGAAVSWGAYLAMLGSPAAQAGVGQWFEAVCGVRRLPAAAEGDGARKAAGQEMVRRCAKKAAAGLSAAALNGLRLIWHLCKLLRLRMPCDGRTLGLQVAMLLRPKGGLAQ